jgi:hypothetical protein
MKRSIEMSKYKAKPFQIPRQGILEAIDRCEAGINPAVVETRTYVVHARKLFGEKVAMSWVIRIIDRSQGVEQ